MRVASQNGASSLHRSRAELAERLRGRRAEIEEAVIVRSYALASGGAEEIAAADPEYLRSLRDSIAAAVEYAFEAIEHGEERAPAPPPALLAQARLAARHGVELATVLRRYSAGYVLLSDFLLEEAERAGLRTAALRQLLRAQAVLDRLLAAVSEEYERESREHRGTTEERRAERIERLLAGEAIDASELAYELSTHHLAVLARGEGLPEAMKRLASGLDCRLLFLARGEGLAWAWLGFREAPEMAELERALRAAASPRLALALGEPGEGLAGWRFSHRQARAAHTVALRSHEPLVRYADVALLAAALRDELLATSLRRLYLEPLERERDGGRVAFETLRAFFAAGENVSSAAAVLGVRRQTVTRRLHAIEDVLVRELRDCVTEVELSLSLFSPRAMGEPA